MGNLNDLWRYSPSTGQWTWISGGSADNASGVYGTQGTAAASNVPGARYAASSWIDSSGNLWLFGGYGYDSTGSVGKLNDLWQFSPSSSAVDLDRRRRRGQCRWGLRHAGHCRDRNVPGARQAASSWIDSSGNLWLFGGVGYDSTGAVGNLNDLWRYSPSSSEWTWVSGGNRRQYRRHLRHAGHARRSATCREGAIRSAPGSTPPATCGCSAAMATTQPGSWATSTTCGNTIRARGVDPRRVVGTPSIGVE